MSLEQINDELKLLDKEHKVSLIVGFYHNVKFFMNTKQIKVCSLFLYDADMFADPFETREALLIEYTSSSKKIKKDFNAAMKDVGLAKIKIDYIAPCFQMQDLFKTVNTMVVEQEQSIDIFMEKFVLPVYSKIYLAQKLDEDLKLKNSKMLKIKI